MKRFYHTGTILIWFEIYLVLDTHVLRLTLGTVLGDSFEPAELAVGGVVTAFPPRSSRAAGDARWDPDLRPDVRRKKQGGHLDARMDVPA